MSSSPATARIGLRRSDSAPVRPVSRALDARSRCQAHYRGFSTGGKGTKDQCACATHRGKAKDVCPAPLLEKLVFEDLGLCAIRDRLLTAENIKELTRLANERLAQARSVLREERERLERELGETEEKLQRLQRA